MRSLWLSIEDRSRGGNWRRFCRAWWRGGVVLLALCAAVYIPGQTALPPVDRDECRFAQASRQMFESVALPAAERDAKMHSGGLVVPMLVDVPRLNKPPLVYWLQSASAALFTWGRPLEDAIWMYRVPSALCALVAVFATWRLGLKMLDPRAALLGAMMLAVAPMVVWDAHQARADQLLLACTTVCMGALWGVWKTRRQEEGTGARRHEEGTKAQGHEGTEGATGSAATAVPSPSAQCPVPSAFGSAFLFWLALAAGIMAKGPVTPLVAGLAIVWLSFTTRSWRWVRDLRPLMGTGIVAVCVVLWVWAVAQRQGGLGPYAQLVWDEFFARGLRGSKEGHFAPPGTHTVLLAALFWPGSLLTLAGFVEAWKRARGHSTSPTRERGGTGASGDTPLLDQGSRERELAALGSSMPKATSWRSWLPWNTFRTPWRGRDAEMFLIAWIVPMWVVFELSLAKLPHYTMPMYPAIALVSARMVMRAAARHALPKPMAWRAWAVIGVLASCVVAAVWLVMGVGTFGEHPASSLGAAIALLTGITALWIAINHRASLLAAQLVALLSAALLLGAGLAPGYLWFVPGYETLGLVRGLTRVPDWRSRAIISEYHEESLVLATRGRVIRSDPRAVEAFAAAHPESLAIVSLDRQTLGVWDQWTYLGRTWPNGPFALFAGPKVPVPDLGGIARP